MDITSKVLARVMSSYRNSHTQGRAELWLNIVQNGTANNIGIKMYTRFWKFLKEKTTLSLFVEVIIIS